MRSWLDTPVIFQVILTRLYISLKQVLRLCHRSHSEIVRHENHVAESERNKYLITPTMSPTFYKAAEFFLKLHSWNGQEKLNT